MGWQTAPLTDEHVAEAAALFCGHYELLCQGVPALPDRYRDPATVTPLLAELFAAGPALGAFSLEGRLVGYIAGRMLPQFLGQQRGVHVPEWAHAVATDAAGRGDLYRQLYAAAAATWVARSHLNHAVTILAGDEDARAAWFWSGFGLATVDAIRDLKTALTAICDESLTVRPAQQDDIRALLPLFVAHQAYYRRSPMFVPKAPFGGSVELAESLADPKRLIWLAADVDGQVLGFMQQRADATNACTIVRDPKTLACDGAYVLPAARRRGTAAALLQQMVSWARRRGFVRLALDFEVTNLPGGRFWLRHFTPVCYSLARRVNDRILVPWDVGTRTEPEDTDL